MRHHFHRCAYLRVISVRAEEVSGDRGRESLILEELCEAKGLGRCLGLAECDVLAPAQKRELLIARVTRMREEEGGATLLGDLPTRRRSELLELRSELVAEREEIVRENRRLHAERIAASDLVADVSADQAGELLATGVTVRLDDSLVELRSARLDAIDRALDAIAQGAYGLCVRCRGPIEILRLRASPDTRVCGFCAKQALVLG